MPLRAVGSASADEAAYVAGTSTLSTPELQTKIENNNGSVLNTNYTIEGVCSMNIEKKNSNSSNVNGANVRWYQNDIMHMTPAENITITKIVFNCSSASYAKIAGVAENAAATGITTSGSTVTWEGSSDNELQFYATAQTRFSSIIITYTKAPEEAVEPTAIEFSLPQDVDYTSVQTVEISADGNDASGKSLAYLL